MLLRENEEIVFSERGTCRKTKNQAEATRGKLIITNQRMAFEVEKKALLGLVSMSKETLWYLEIDEVSDITTIKRSLLGKRSIHVQHRTNEAFFKLFRYDASEGQTKIIKAIEKGRKLADLGYSRNRPTSARQ